jgi:hypothetical protein
MKPQTLALIAASTITGVFLATVGLVLALPLLTAPTLDRQFAVNNFNPQFAPLANFEAPVEKVQPLAKEDLPQVRGVVVPTQDYALSAPHTHGNLTIFLIHGPDTMKNTKVLTLQEALEQNIAVVHDSGVRLTIDNRGNAPLFIQSGDIVKGGNQDRTLPYDMLVPAHTNGTPIAALCVEQGRSIPRGNELSESFQISSEQLPSRQLKLAAYRQSQNDVWNNVRTLQDNLTRITGGSVKAQQSSTSLQLSLEHARVQRAVQKYFAPLAPVVEGKNDVIGYAVVINGKIQSADVYASNAMFQKLWPKLIRASAVEALAERQPGAVIKPPNAEAVQAFLAEAEKGQAFRVDANRSTVIRQETPESLLHDTCDPTQENLVLHRSVLAK